MRTLNPIGRIRCGPDSRASILALALLGMLLAPGTLHASAAALPPPPTLSAPATRFDPVRDVFSFSNGLRWSYDQSRGSATQVGENRANSFDQHCSQMARGIRQFFYAARFAPEQARVPEQSYRELVGRVVDSDPRSSTPLDEPITIPGYADLRSFSQDHEQLLKESLGGIWRAYHQRGNWRMIFPFSPRHQRRTADALLDSIEGGHPPIVHLVRFPIISVNHTLLLYRAQATPTEVHFSAYDPNEPQREVTLTYVRGEARFSLERTPYWRGGTVTAYEIFDDWIN